MLWCAGFPKVRRFFCGRAGALKHRDSVFPACRFLVATCRFSCAAACDVLVIRPRIEPGPLHWKADSQPLDHHPRSPRTSKSSWGSWPRVRTAEVQPQQDQKYPRDEWRRRGRRQTDTHTQTLSRRGSFFFFFLG